MYEYFCFSPRNSDLRTCCPLRFSGGEFGTNLGVKNDFIILYAFFLNMTRSDLPSK
jgi:hypothetical protein